MPLEDESEKTIEQALVFASTFEEAQRNAKQEVRIGFWYHFERLRWEGVGYIPAIINPQKRERREHIMKLLDEVYMDRDAKKFFQVLTEYSDEDGFISRELERRNNLSRDPDYYNKNIVYRLLRAVSKEVKEIVWFVREVENCSQEQEKGECSGKKSKNPGRFL